MVTTTSSLLTAALALALAATTTAHSWIEQIALITPNGTYSPNFGYPRGYIGRTDPTFTGGVMVNLIPSLTSHRTRINSSDLLCMSSQSSPSTQPAAYPRLSVTPGSTVALRYLENGHVTLPQNQPGKSAPSRGTTFVFGTTQPLDDELLTDVLAWNTNGTAGDARGALIAATNYDDGRCHQINGGAISKERQAEFPNPIPGQTGTNLEIWCETDVTLPADLKPGSVYTAYWVWDWKTQPGTPGLPGGKDEYYTTCMDFDVVAEGSSNVSPAAAAVKPSGAATGLPQQDPNTLAVSDWMSRTAVSSLPDVAFATMADWGSTTWQSIVSLTSATAVVSSSYSASASVTATSGLAVATSSSTTGEALSTSYLTSSSASTTTTTAQPPTFPGQALIPVPLLQSLGNGNANSTTSSTINTTSTTTSASYYSSSSPLATSTFTGMPLNPSSANSSTSSTASSTTASTNSSADIVQVMTALITVTATMPAGQSVMVVKGEHVVTFSL